MTFATVAAVLSLASCSNNDDPAEPNLGSAPVVVSVALDTTMTHFTTYDTESRAGGQPVLRLQVHAIADKDHRVLARETRLIRPGQPLGGEVRFTLPSGKHHLLAWADYVADSATPTDLYYHTADLTDISFMGSTYVGDNDQRNAYAATAPVEFKVYEGDTTTVIHSDLSLKSIMGKLRFVATDYNEWLSKAQPLRVLVSYTGFLPNRYSVLRGVPFDSTTGISFLTSMRDGSTESGTVTLAEDLVMVNGDEAKIKQVITNLINNAVKYCGEDKVIQVSLRRIRGKVRCEVTDHGQGIAPDEINHVWERYYKSSTHHVRQTEGSGLGLSIVREILSLHKAGYGVESELNEGSTFWFEMDVLKTKPQKKQN